MVLTIESSMVDKCEHIGQSLLIICLVGFRS